MRLIKMITLPVARVTVLMNRVVGAKGRDKKGINRALARYRTKAKDITLAVEEIVEGSKTQRGTKPLLHEQIFFEKFHVSNVF